MGKRKAASSPMIVQVSKKKKVFSNEEAKTIKKLAKRVIQKEAETKVGYANIQDGMVAERILSYNYVYQCGITQGTGGEDSRIIGNRFNMVGLKARGRVINSDNKDKDIILAIIETDKYVTTANLNALDVFPSYSLIGFPQRYDSSRVKVLAKEKIKLRNYIAGVNTVQEFEMYVPYKKKCELSGDTSGAYDLNGKNLYFVAYSYVDGGTPGSTAVNSIFGVLEMFYKDI